MADYNTECGSVPLSLVQMLASAMAGYHDIAGVIHYRLNGQEAANNDSELSDYLDCDISHLDPERQLVENVFVLDDCGRLAIKLFDNSDNDWTKYSECGEVPQTFVQLLARCIRTYLTINRLNVVIEGDACTEVEALLDCDVNGIEAERMLVTNVFGVDDAGNMLLRLYRNSSTMTDFHTECTEAPQSFIQLLARCIVLYDDAGWINIAEVQGYCDDLHDFWTCSNNHITPERAMVENLFATDDCGNLALKYFDNQSLAPQ